MDNKCANTLALNAYLEIQAKADEKMDIIEKAVNAIIYEVEEALGNVVYEHDIDYALVRDMFFENAREII